ncbi:CPBP family intramembrane metalloprotease [Aquibacillus sp. 3ASR75-11]|uniref:CPBP family intramembrane metalloprotease n=1 Tax=Terrihalobacillus insolitus TaxID=2950438 RepID=A0A9X3WZI6_9BACI|nr:type II CAAX endopeptidase family protein [Terrihalobacillus insolitus]MDC3414225.1 CPBP family intramembrane metalloprotease [Terrihalobacillus insolitus]MDC3426224.1 CPBP family intramembrane metalloprotease [Terrihalobacillus insolitus]
MPQRYWYVILTYILMQLSSVIAVPIIETFGVTRLNAMVGWSVFSFFLALLVVLYLLKEDMQKGSERGAAKIGNVILWCIAGVFMAYIAQYAAVLIETYVFKIEPASENTMNIMQISKAAPIFIIVPVLIAPILEEIIFRKIIFGSLYERMNLLLAVIGSALIFALIHMEPTHLLIYSSMGLVFAYLYVKTKRIIVPIVTHMAMNTIAVITQFNLTPEDYERMREQMKQLQMILIGG